MKLHRLLSYGLMAAGTLASAKRLQERERWERANVRVGIMLDWDDLQSIVTRALTKETVPHTLQHLQAHGATHIGIPELTLKRLLDRGQLSVESGSGANQVHLRVQTPELAEVVTAELYARLPHLHTKVNQAENPVISFQGDLPSVTEIGLGFDPTHFATAHEAGLVPVARPIGYSWVQPSMVERTLNQAAELGAKIIAVQGNMTPGFEYYVDTTVDAIKRNGLYYAYFSESRHQRGDWHLAKSLAPTRQVILAHEFMPDALLEEDSGTVSRRWVNLAAEAGIRLCCVRFFRVIHAGDPMEAMDYISQLSEAMWNAGMVVSTMPEENLQIALPEQDDQALSMAGLSIAGAGGLAADLLPLPDAVKLLGTALGAMALARLPYLENRQISNISDHHHDHDQSHDHDHDQSDHPHNHDDHHHGHDHTHHGHSHGPPMKTAYASKGLALAASIAVPTAIAASNGANPVKAVVHAALTSVAGATALNAVLTDADYLLGVEEYRSYNLDWLLPIGLASVGGLTNRGGIRRWLSMAAMAGAALRFMGNGAASDPLAQLDREHRHAHTHHISSFQQYAGDGKMALSPKPLRKWSLLVPLGVASAAIFRRRGKDSAATIASIGAAIGGAATMAGFRNTQRPFHETVAGRARGWRVGLLLAAVIWLISLFFKPADCSNE